MPSLSAQLKAQLAHDNLTLYGAALIAGAELDEEIKTIHRRLSKYTADSPPETLVQFEETLRALGYQLSLTRIPRH